MRHFHIWTIYRKSQGAKRLLYNFEQYTASRLNIKTHCEIKYMHVYSTYAISFWRAPVSIEDS